MPDGHRINTPPNHELPNTRHEYDSPHLQGNSEHDSPPPGLKHNAAQHFNHEWQTARASELKNNLLTILQGSEHNAGHIFSTAAPHVDYAGQNLQNLINLAREHADFKNFQNRTENFWQNVSRMSEVRILQSQAGDLQLVSRYGELLDKFNTSGRRLDAFLLTLPANERDVFAARYQMEKTFGAGRFFIGNGITPDKNGNFSLRQFLASNGKSTNLPLNFIVALRESGQLGAGNFAGRILFNAESAALLGASLAFYQNLGAAVNLKDAVIYIFLQNFLAAAEENAALRLPVNLFSNEAPSRKIDQTIIVGALINGTLPSIDKNSRFFDKINLEAWTGGDASMRLVFSAGATGAMLGAAIGCLVPLAGDAAGRATGLAASIVTGTAERGLRSLDLNLLISDVVTNAVQTLLDALQDNFLMAAPRAELSAAPLVEDLQSNFFNRRLNAYLAA
ncbi:MAG TPA: hypothetical protein VGC76_18400 [Pyrinomonadaceae bacterium]|jgi:hypothetical protein